MTNEEIYEEINGGRYNTRETALELIEAGRIEGAAEQREEMLEAFSVLSDFYAQKGRNDVCDNIRRQIQAIRAQREEWAKAQ